MSTLTENHIDNAYSVVWGHAWQSLNNFNEPDLVQIGKRGPHRAAFIRRKRTRDITQDIEELCSKLPCVFRRQHPNCKETSQVQEKRNR